jgi:uncharacterized protein involved in exopolysaccharide biosynthesis
VGRQYQAGQNAPTGAELLQLIDGQLFPQLKALDGKDLEGIAQQRALLLRSVFEDAYNYMKSGTLLRQVVDKINESIDFNESKPVICLAICMSKFSRISRVQEMPESSIRREQ